MMRKIIAATTTAITLAVAGPALAGGSSSSFNLDLGVGGNAGINGKIEGGSYAFGKNGSDAFAQSSNFVETFGVSNVGLGESSNYGVSSSWGKSLAKTSGKGAKAEAFETRKMKFDNFTRFNVDMEMDKNFGGFGGW
jgi:hypothetical protein